MVSESASKQKVVELGQWAYGIVTLLIILIVSFIGWYIFIDPQTAIFKIYPQPFGAILFWAILAVVWQCFNSGFWPFFKLNQPLAGILGLAAGLALTALVLWVINYLWGYFDPTFSYSREGGLGWLTSAMFVLFGFYWYGAIAAQFAHWPFQDGGLENQPLLGIAEIMLATVISLICYLFIIFPNLAVWAKPGNVLMDMPTGLGWFYTVIVIYVVSLNNTDGLPYNLANSRAGNAICSVIGNFVLGTLFYFIFLWFLRTVLIPADVLEAIRPGFNLWAAELGVCIVMWSLMWALLFGNYPTNFSKGANIIIRLVIIFALGILSFMAYYNGGVAVNILHEPKIAGSFGGDALLWMDWVIYVLFVYCFYFGTYPFKVKPVK
jgi:AAT family amino acid transporter